MDAPLRHLTRAQYHRAVLDLFAPLGWTTSPASRFPADEKSGPFATNSIPVTSATELTRRLARSKAVKQCLVTQWYRYALGRLETEADAPELAQLQRRFLETDGAIPDLLVALTTSDAFRSRAP